ncbi:adenosylcobinamide-GDP ribazoletransferase [Dermacoccus barathri]|uniref:adenosylcobinamide-GDP ribazoletransferase n=1 Tax=Dermacoccus barathri TaxID=322601 RepID=UPI001D0D1839|nr:adenosylcobinamide-GDP ribazoletransferase [Dermacoccus barathri]
MASLLAGLRLAMGTLSVVPVGEVDTSRPTARVAMTLAPVAALPVAVGVGLTVWAADLAQLSPLVVGFLAVAVSALLTRCMHLDGLADTADGLGAGWDRERALAVMKRGDVGPMGAVALVVVLGLEAASVAALVDHPVVIGAAWCAGRAACTALAAGPSPATTGGMGALMTRTVSPAVAALAVALVALALAGVAALSGLQPIGACVAAAVAVVVVNALVIVCRRSFGGITGDVFGAAVEVATATLLVVLASGAWR